ncbi:MAG: L-serine ammonia-lyase, iron-sulfur-dependent subunit beta [Synergistaceae bacterium]|nr:L-serine ammonia-lyase, iron-sulfur-dependent subunit beta [Synergistaceae bacterium]
MPVWDIIGPVMIGPSSSHTAGAVRIGRIVRLCWGRDVKNVNIYMRGSFATTGEGHGTDRAILAGLLGYAPDDPEVRDGRELALASGMKFRFYEEDIEGSHPNSVRIEIWDGSEKKMDATAASLGGGAVSLQQLDGFEVEVSCLLPVIIIMNKDVQGVVGAVTTYLSSHGVNIATMKLHRNSRGGLATMVLELDSNEYAIKPEEIKVLHDAIARVISIPGVTL